MNNDEKKYIFMDESVAIFNDSSSIDAFEDEVLKSNLNAQTFFCSEKDTSTEGDNPLEQRGGTLIAPSPKEELQYVPEQDNNHSGNGEGYLCDNKGGGGGSGDDTTVDLKKIIERFEKGTRARLKPRTSAKYKREFLRFAERSNLAQYTRQQLKGRKAKELILFYLERISIPSRRVIISYLRLVWVEGLDLPWPIDAKREIGRLPRTRREGSPPDAIVQRWATTMKNEPDIYLKLLWLLIAQHGWRPSHVIKLRWANVRFDDTGMPIAIVADGVQDDFKTFAPIAVKLTPDVQEVLIEWRAILKEPHPERPLLPWRSCNKQLEPSRPLNYSLIREIWWRIAKKWGLPALRPKDMRHWVASACRKAGLSKQASAYLMGHDPTQGGAMRDWYDAPQLEDVFLEQAKTLPRGPLGTFEPPTVQLVEGIPSEVLELVKAYITGELPTLQFMEKIEVAKLRQHAQSTIIQP